MPGRKSRTRAKSVDGPRSPRPVEEHRPNELIHSVSIEDKRKVVRKKSKKELEAENITLDAARHLLQEKINQTNFEKADLSNALEKMKIDNIKLETDLENERERHREEQIKQRQAFDQDMKRLREENRKKNEELVKELKESLKYVGRFSETLESNQAKVYISGSCENVQVGESNNITHNVMSRWQELTDKLLPSIGEYIEKRQRLEKEVHSLKVELKELQHSIHQIVKSIDKTRNKIPDRERELLSFLAADRSDRSIFTEGIKQLKCYKNKKNLPISIDAMVERLLNKFEGFQCGEFVAILEGKKYGPNKETTSVDTDQTEVKQEIDSIPLQEFDNNTILERKNCLEILSKWIHISDENDDQNFIEKIKAYESKKAEELKTKYKDEIKSKDVSSYTEKTKPSANSSSQYEGPVVKSHTQSSEQSLSGLPDALSLFMHQLEGLEIVIEINRKVDKMSKQLDAMTDPISPHRNVRHNNTNMSSDV